MNALYNHAVKQRNLLQRDLEKFERELFTAPISLQGSIATALVSLEKSIDQYKNHLAKFETVLQDDNKEDHIKYQTRLSSLENTLTESKELFHRLRQQYNSSSAREQIFNNATGAAFDEGVTTTNKRSVPSQQQLPMQLDSQRSTIHSSGGLPLYEGLKKEHSIFARTNSQLDTILKMGQESLEDIIEQNHILQQAQRKMVSTLQVLGVSNETIDRISRHVFKDKMIFWIALILMFVGFYYALKLLG
ncbi:Bos1p Ecym_1536 [Eremothecium cymbalariae DBVPG|uniref:Protein transport protein BOS1 n=1 Tax=Eremothecium cymbalariae (strain CBS 270.75 / DBVPG 7215 / KCTC 17166 / NRRL Y-17582) TaxID=931890 RepID=G8JMU1_ERECY|nr:hypothetical protein Ecym_1536 [Eremothecium cymbalariae DBVPG\